MSDDRLYDVVAISLADSSVLWTMGPESKENAEAVVHAAIVRQGVEDRYFVQEPAGRYKRGDQYRPRTAK